MKPLWIILLFLIGSGHSFAQAHTIRGYVKDKVSGDALPNAYISVLPDGMLTVANDYGCFSVRSESSRVQLEISFTGYDKLIADVVLHGDTTLSFWLQTNNQLSEVEVVGNGVSQTVKEQEIGAFKMTGRELEKVPSLLGERDLVKALQLMPGIKMGREGTSGMYVRGGTPGQNLILLDDVPVYNVNHLFGFFSVFTPEAVKSVDIYKGAFPAQYGGRISSVMDVKIHEGNLYRSSYDLTIGLLSSKLVAEIPLKKEKASLLLSGRRTYFDLLLAPYWKTTSWDKRSVTKSGYNFYDFNAKLFWDAGDAGKFYGSFYTGRDSYFSQTKTNSGEEDANREGDGLYEVSKSSYNWGNYTASLRWNKAFGQKLFLNTTFLYSHYSYVLDFNRQTEEVYPDTLTKIANYNNLSSVTDYGIYADFDHYLSNNHQLAYGVRATWHQFRPSFVVLNSTSGTGSNVSAEVGSFEEALEVNSYVEDKITLGSRYKLHVGLHHSLYATRDTSFSVLQPRVRASAEFSNCVLKLSAGYMSQPVHNLVNNSSGMAIDIWVPSGKGVKPSASLQFDLGADWHLNNRYIFSAVGYYRAMDHILTYRKGESFFSLYRGWTQKVTSGNGQSHGVEVLARKTEGRTTGWVGYTWSVSTQKFALLNNGKSFPAPYDRTHYFTVSVNHRFSEKLVLSGNWVFASGEPLTVSSTAYTGDLSMGKASQEIDFGPFTKQLSAPDEIIYYPSVNNYRLPCYHRLDVGIDLYKKKKWGTRVWSFSVYNLYGRNNPFMVSVENENGKLVLKNVSLFRFLPSISYRYIFK